jgi:predicted hydrocarbon binding protein
VPLDEVVDLVRLILRRPDADPILREAGAQLAHRQFERLPSLTAALLGVLPRAARARLLRRASRRLLKEIVGPARIEMKDWPRRLRITGSPLTGAEGDRTACALYAAVLEKLVELYTGSRVEAIHTLCTGHGHEHCEWTLEEASATA